MQYIIGEQTLFHTEELGMRLEQRIRKRYARGILNGV